MVVTKQFEDQKHEQIRNKLQISEEDDKLEKTFQKQNPYFANSGFRHADKVSLSLCIFLFFFSKYLGLTTSKSMNNWLHWLFCAAASELQIAELQVLTDNFNMETNAAPTPVSGS